MFSSEKTRGQEVPGRMLNGNRAFALPFIRRRRQTPPRFFGRLLEVGEVLAGFALGVVLCADLSNRCPLVMELDPPRLVRSLCVDTPWFELALRSLTPQRGQGVS